MLPEGQSHSPNNPSGDDSLSPESSGVPPVSVEAVSEVDSERHEKLSKGIKIVIGGPPHSGKSVFIEALRANLSREDTYTFSACPDGEGSWLQRHYDDPDVVALRRKGGFTPEFVEWATDSVSDWYGQLMLIDIGGRTSDENAKIVQGATHAIILAGDTSAIPEWKEFFESKGIQVVAALHSNHPDHKDRFGDPGFLWSDNANDPIRASVHHLERGEPAEGRETIQLVAEVIQHLVQENQPNRPEQETDLGHFKINVASLRAELPTTQVERRLLSGQTIVTANLIPSAIPVLYQKIADQPHDQEVWLDGPTNSWEIIAMACALDEAGAPGIRYNSPNGFVELQRLAISNQPSMPESGWGWEVSRQVSEDEQKYIEVEIIHNPSVPLSPESLAQITLPEVDEGDVVVISGKIPQWLRASVALGYMGKCAAIAAFQPGEGSTVAWSRDSSLPLGAHIS